MSLTDQIWKVFHKNNAKHSLERIYDDWAHDIRSRTFEVISDKLHEKQKDLHQDTWKDV